MRLRIIAHTVLKQQPKQSSDLADSEKLAARVGDEFALLSYEAAENQHFKVVLAQPLGNNRLVWYAFQPHIELVPDATEEAGTAVEDAVKPAPAVAETPPGLSSAEADMTSNAGCGSAVAVLGALLLIVPAVQLLNPSPDRLNAGGWGALGVGGMSVAFGTWLAVDALVAGRQAKRDRIQSTFFNLLETSSGEITVLQFARAANLSGEEAQKYLDTKAKEFNATFDVGSEGGIYYRFK
ncbi:hypothetical protein [Pseudanabaena sp. FACHB-2040]|uniref:hypothetical protein n=1 Tax=Pseudanabaena sp. FACHB-2040 TaxID=2692859 RepID=UPI0016848ABE|nr:hypothetical protein [Pseudanabaena sp. FACHB-2040]MBD2259746.1 hypothetical protein [Pseudanabaena sp. FACHB-2040]